MKKIVTIISVIGIFVSGFTVSVMGYSSSKASEYAKKYATNYNENYPSFAADCTNFASQCVKAGGISTESVPNSKIGYSNIDNIYKTKDYWNCSKYKITTTVLGKTVYKKTGYVTTSTWSVVSKNQKDSWWGFYNYMKNRGASVQEFKVDTEENLNKFIRTCAIGDVLQIRNSTNDNKYHSVIVTDKSYDKKNKRYDMKIVYHSNDTKPVDFRNVSCEAFGKSALWTVIKVSQIH